MSKRPDFARDVAGVKLDVSEGVASILSAVSQRPIDRETRPSLDSSASSIEPAKRPETPAAKTVARRPRTTPQAALAGEPLALRNVTTKLPSATKELLREAALRQRLKRAVPDTEQGIIDDALQAWFKRHGYGRRLTALGDSPAAADPDADEPASSE